MQNKFIPHKKLILRLILFLVGGVGAMHEGGTVSATVLVAVNGIGDSSSNPERGCLRSTSEKLFNSHLQLTLNSWAD